MGYVLLFCGVFAIIAVLMSGMYLIMRWQVRKYGYFMTGDGGVHFMDKYGRIQYAKGYVNLLETANIAKNLRNGDKDKG